MIQIRTHFQVGVRDGKRGYPREDSYVELPLYALPIVIRAAGNPSTDAKWAAPIGEPIMSEPSPDTSAGPEIDAKVTSPGRAEDSGRT